jgi:hypothetical protein
VSKVRLKKGPYGVKVASVQPPHELVGEFLTVEGSGLDGWATTEVAAVVERTTRGEAVVYRKYGDGHELRIESGWVTISSVHSPTLHQVVLTTDEFKTYLSEWVRLLTSCRVEQI